LGITLVEALAALIVMLILILYNMTAILAQIMFRELFQPKAFANGLCLVHPLIALGALAVITGPTVFGPIMAAQIAANIPLIVEAR
jgi:CBS domain containing-hemolysin-like protein